MTHINRAALGLTLALTLTAIAGCSDNIALVGRPTLQLGQDEFVAQVDRLDTSSREIHLQPNSGRTRVVGYCTEARVLYRGREYPVSQLEAGDIVAMQLKQDSRGNSYTDLIRVQESIRDRDQSRGGSIRPGTGNQMSMGGWSSWTSSAAHSKYAISPENGSWFLSLTMLGGRMSIISGRFGFGDYVKVEGRFLDRERFELENFLRDNR